MISITDPYMHYMTLHNSTKVTHLSMLSAMCFLLMCKIAGRPPKEVDIEVKHLLTFDFQLDEIAAIVDVSRSTLYRRMKDSGIEKYSDISDPDLDNTI